MELRSCPSYWGFLCFLLFCGVCCLAIPEGPHINTLNVLLPPKATHPIRYRLQGSGGCFTWTWDHHDIIHVRAESRGTDDCSESAVVTSIAAYQGRRATSVYAKDKLTGQVIRCEVFIDNISRIRISHHSLKLDLDGLATLRIHAFDLEDNMFSSLVGIQFLWKLFPAKTYTGTLSHCLAHVPLKNTPLSDCGCFCEDIDTRIEFEDQGLGSDLFVVRGMDVGQERVSANVVEPTLDRLGDEILLTVAEAIYIEPPSPLYVLVDMHIQFTLKTLRYKHPSVIHLPSPHHRWSVVDPLVAEVDPLLGNVTTKNVGSTLVIVQDIRVEGHEQISSLHVVVPSSLKLFLTPLSFKDVIQQTSLKKEMTLESSDTPWCLVAGWDYVVQAMAFSAESGSTPIYLTKADSLSFSYDDWPFWKSIPVPEDVEKEQGWHNGTLIKAVAEGAGSLSATLKFRNPLIDRGAMEVLVVRQEVLVCNPVVISPDSEEMDRVLRLPWNPIIVQAYQLKVQGGCGSQPSDYRWVSLDPNIAAVNSLGVVQARGLGQGVVRVMAVTNPLNQDEIRIDVSCPGSILRVEGLPLETEVGSYLPAAATLKNSNGLYFSICDSFASLIDWRVASGDGSFVNANTTSKVVQGSFELPSGLPAVCDWTYLWGLRPGRATVTASLVIDKSCGLTGSALPNKLSVSWTVSAFAPLTIVQAGDGQSHGGYRCSTNHLESPGSIHVASQCQLSVLRLVPGSGVKVMLRGGPDPWGQGVEFIERHEVILDHKEKGSESLRVSHLASSGGRFYDIACVSPGNYTVVFHRGNWFGADHATSKIASVSLSVMCSLPSSISLLVDAEHTLQNIKASALAQRDHNRVHISFLTVVSGRSLRVSAVALDATGHPFANASSLPVDWMLADCLDLAHWKGGAASEAHIDNGKWEEYLMLNESTGQCLVRALAQLSPSHKRFLSALQHGSDMSHQILTDAVRLELVTTLRVEPKFLLLYNAINAKGFLTVSGGSSRIEAYSNDTKVAVVLEKPVAPDFMHMTVAARGLGSSEITVKDVGLISPTSNTALVAVAEVAWVRLLLPEEASIQVGSLLEIRLQAGDNAGNVFSDSQLEYMDIQAHVKDEVLELVSGDEIANNKITGSSFTVRGANVGVTDIYVSVVPKYGHDIVSDLRKIEVYEPLAVQPESLVLAPGARYVLTVRGGPTIGVSLKFESSNATVVSVENPVGMVAANLPGLAAITVQAITHTGSIVCTASTDVRVHIPESMALNVRGGGLAIGRRMSIYPTGTQEDLFAFYGQCGSYEWAVEDTQVVTIFTSNYLKRETNEETVSTSNASGHRERNSIDSGFSVVAIGRSPGKTDISVAFTCRFRSEKGHVSTHSYSASASIQVLADPPLALGISATWLLPPNYRTSNLLPQSSDFSTESTPAGKRTIVYSMLQDTSRDSASIVLEGARIRTSERMDMACVQARDRRTGRSEIAVCLRVAEVAHMLIGDTDCTIRRMEVSVGAYHLYPIILQDDLGTPFHEVGRAVCLKAETNRADIVSVRVLTEEDDDYDFNATLLVQALRQGTAMIRVWQFGNPSVVDYILVDVGAFITPRNPTFHVGGHVNFSIVGKGLSSKEHGHWSSSNPDVLQIDTHTGEALAVGPGSISVSYNSSYLTAYTTATVIQISSIVVKAPKGQLLTNVHVPEQGYLFPVKFSDQRGQDVGLVSTDQRISYTCYVDPPYLGRCMPWCDPESGASFCAFHPYPPERLFLTLQGLGEEAKASLMVGDSRGCLTIKIMAEVPELPEVGSATASFAGGFKIQDKPLKILLTPTNNKTKLMIVGSAGGVHVSWTRTDALEVKRVSPDQEAYGFGGRAVYEVTVFNGEQPFASSLVFQLPTTGRVEEVHVEYDVKDQPDGALLQRIISAIIAIVVLGLVPCIACARLFDWPRRRQQEHSVSDSDGAHLHERVANGSPMSPTRNLQPGSYESPQSISLSRSPPQPYSDYISKTIENTPYFRREGMRRYDPSRTY